MADQQAAIDAGGTGMTVELTTSESEKIARARTSAADVVTRVHAIEIADDKTAGDVASFLRDLATVAKRADDERLALTKPHRDHAARINDAYREPARMLDEAISEVKAKLLAWRQEQERIRREEQARLDAIAAEQRAADERAREEAAAEARADAERWAAEQRAREKAAEVAPSAEATAAAEAAKAAQEAFERLERARAVEPLPVRDVAIAAPPERQEGVATRKDWTFRVVDVRALGAEFVLPNEKAIRAEMQAQVREGMVPRILGVEFEQVERLTARARDRRGV